uniref:Uncharacterized protein n=1 Tax=Ditylenchus dipsaci TaxID=166011 RepID=A0A915DJA6_9BILA
MVVIARHIVDNKRLRVRRRTTRAAILGDTILGFVNDVDGKCPNRCVNADQCNKDRTKKECTCIANHCTPIARTITAWTMQEPDPGHKCKGPCTSDEDCRSW